MKDKKLLSILGVVLLWVSMANAQKAYNLKFNPANGSRYGVVMNTTTKMLQDIMGQQMEMNMNMDINATYNISDEASNKKMSMTYDTMKMLMEVMGKKIVMNSNDADTSKEQNKVLRSMIGKTISVILSPQGKVLKVEGAEDIIKGLAGKPAQQEAMKGVFGEEALKSSIEQSFRFYPDKPVKVGDKWMAQVQLNQGFSVNGNYNYTLSKVEGKKAFIDVTGTLLTDSTSKLIKNGMEMIADLAGDMTGTMEVDIDSGMPLTADMQVKLKGNMEVMGQKVPLVSSTGVQMIVVKN